MTNSIQTRETLSALLDGQANELEIRRVLKALDNDPDSLATWARFNHVQSVIHNHDVVPVSNGFGSRMAAIIAEEPGLTASVTKANRWAQIVTKFAVAASVALAFFLGIQSLVQSPATTTPAMVQAVSPADTGSLPAVVATVPDSVEVVSGQVDPAARQRLENYIRSVSITRDEPAQLEQLRDSPLYRLVNEVQPKP